MLNKVILMGRITHHLELKRSQNGKDYLKFTIAINRDREDEKTDFIDCIVWEKTARFINEYFSKGRLIAVEGSINTTTYEDKEGKKRKGVSVFVHKAYFTGESKDKKPESVITNIADDDLPF